MRSPIEIRWLPVAVLMAAWPAAGQAPARPYAGTATASASVLPASGAAPTAPPVAQAPASQAQGVQATPEELGDSMMARQRYQAAIADYVKVQHPSAEVWNKMGIAYQMLLNLKDAQRCYRESIKLNPHNASVMNNLATVYDTMKDYKQAEKTYRKALKVSPTSAIVYKNLGTNLMAQHKYSKGLVAYREAMELDPSIFTDSSSPHVANPANLQERGAINYYMALGCVRGGQTDCALEYLRMALDEGFTTAKKLASDEGFLSLRDNPGFQQLLADQKQHPQQKQ